MKFYLSLLQIILLLNLVITRKYSGYIKTYNEIGSASNESVHVQIQGEQGYWSGSKRKHFNQINTEYNFSLAKIPDLGNPIKLRLIYTSLIGQLKVVRIGLLQDNGWIFEDFDEVITMKVNNITNGCYILTYKPNKTETYVVTDINDTNDNRCKHTASPTMTPHINLTISPTTSPIVYEGLYAIQFMLKFKSNYLRYNHFTNYSILLDEMNKAVKMAFVNDIQFTDTVNILSRMNKNWRNYFEVNVTSFFEDTMNGINGVYGTLFNLNLTVYNNNLFEELKLSLMDDLYDMSLDIKYTLQILYNDTSIDITLQYMNTIEITTTKLDKGNSNSTDTTVLVYIIAIISLLLVFCFISLSYFYAKFRVKTKKLKINIKYLEKENKQMELQNRQISNDQSISKTQNNTSNNSPGINSVSKTHTHTLHPLSSTSNTPQSTQHSSIVNHGVLILNTPVVVNNTTEDSRLDSLRSVSSTKRFGNFLANPQLYGNISVPITPQVNENENENNNNKSDNFEGPKIPETIMGQETLNE